MYLKRLEILGFKSFADRTVIDFHPGVTAIVGPNGCGKSNVLDAIRWALGEQSARAIRGSSMTDVIFSGADGRKPLNVAEVTLTFADCERDLDVEWNEVGVTRRVYRDGSADYLLNRKPCLLRDIQRLFMDTGIGRAAYSIMEQGRIGLLLSLRPEDRRSVFEEAAGVTKYKAQRREAQHKLEQTEANLRLVEVNIREVKRQIISLQRQAGKARRYEALHADLRTLDTHLGRHKLDTLDRERHDADTRARTLESEETQRSAEVRAQQDAQSRNRARLEKIDAEIASIQESIHQIDTELRDAENQIRFNGERAAETRDLIQRHAAEIEALENRTRSEHERLAQIDQQAREAADAAALAHRLVAEGASAFGAIQERRHAHETDLARLNDDIAGTDARLIQLRTEIAATAANRENARARLESLGDETDQLAAAARRSEARRRELAGAFEAAGQRLATHTRAGGEIEAEINAIHPALARVEEDLLSLQRDLANRDTRRDALRQLNDQGQGLADGTQAALRRIGSATAPHTGALPALIDVEPTFVAAVEAALGERLQTLLVGSVEHAAAILAELARERIGRAQIAPADLLPASAPEDERIPAPEGTLGPALARVTAPPTLEPLLARLLRRVHLVADLETALRLKTAHAADAFATIAGEFVSHEGIIHGGRPHESNSSILQRKTEIAALEVELAELGRTHVELRARRDELGRRISERQEALAENRRQVHAAQIEAAALSGQMDLLGRASAEDAGRIEALESERGQIGQLVRDLADAAHTLEQDAADADATLAETRSRRQVATVALEQLRREENAAADTLNERRIAEATGRQRAENLEHQRDAIQTRLGELDETIASRRAEITRYRERIDTLDRQSGEAQTGLATARRTIEERRALLHEQQAIRREAAAATRALDDTLAQIRAALDQIRVERGDLQVRLTQIQIREENVQEHVSRRYGVELDGFQPAPESLEAALARARKASQRAAERDAEGDPQRDGEDETPSPGAEPAPTEAVPLAAEAGALDWTAIEQAVEALSTRLDAIGPVNLDAIQEFAELEERFAFLDTQNTDLNRSRDELLEAIRRINRTSEALFRDTFEQIRTNFQEMYQQLFGGGNADLVLMDTDDPLECGIEIVARPPGKHLQSITPLSGGERALTALALLFGIYMFKPSPFCVLDEMDAPLDDTNIHRFIQVLERFVGQSQFLVISHNKRTIARADHLYGVTMQTRGISKVMAMRFTRSEQPEQSDSVGAADIVLPPDAS